MANLQSRSTSISTPDNETPGSPSSAILNAKNVLRSSSMGSNAMGSSFFHKDGLNFFNDEKSEPVVPPVTSELDIVGAFGTLKLDEDFEDQPETSDQTELSTSSSGSKPEPSKSSTPFLQQPQFLQGIGHAPHVLHGLPGSLTPNPPSVGAFSSQVPGSLTGTTSTPLNTWGNNFVPFSAPPFAYPMADLANASELAMLIAPFELPDEKRKEPGINVSGMSSASPQPMHHFGGTLDSRFAFGNFSSGQPFEFPEFQPSGEDSPPDSDSGKKKLQFLENEMASSRGFGDKSQMMATPPPHLAGNMWNQPHQYMNQYAPNRSNTERMGQTDLYNCGQSNGNVSRFNNGGYVNNPHNLGGNNNRHRQNYNMNAGVNVHRKMHNSNRRKGDDASKYVNAKLEDFTGDIYSLCKDQHGCRFLQRQLDLGSEAAAEVSNEVAATMIFNEIYLKIVELMTDPFGNYLIQKLFENVSPDQRLILVKNAAPEFIRIALDPHGTRALQKLVECISTPEESRLIIESLSPHIVSLSRDLNGNHVVQKCLQKLKPDDNQFIFHTASVHCNEIATHRHGCCVLQRCLDHGTRQQRKQLSLKVAENATHLSLDPFGNYVVQYVLSRGDDESIETILRHIRSNIISLSLHKFGSNVIEKSLRINRLTDGVIDVLLKNSEKFGLLLNDPFGNYVLQTSLDVATAADLAKLALALQPLLVNIKNTPHGRRIMTKIQNAL